MPALYFKRSRYDRPAEPVSVSVPLARGRLPEPGGLSIRDAGGRALPCNARLAHK